MEAKMGSAAILPLLRKPNILELPGVPEFYADLGIVVGGEETMRILLATARGAADYELCARLFMPRSGFLKSLTWAVLDHGAGYPHH